MKELKERLKQIESRIVCGLPITDRERSLYILYAENPKLNLIKQ